MLVLSRRVGEEIVIDNNIRITIVSVKGDRVRIGVAAPKNVAVDRAEVHERRVQFDVVVPVHASTDEEVLLGESLEPNPTTDTLRH